MSLIPAFNRTDIICDYIQRTIYIQGYTNSEILAFIAANRDIFFLRATAAACKKDGVEFSSVGR
jgi:hypothetical protein